MWRNWNPLNPPINPAHSSDEEQGNYESADENDLVSPNRPHQSPSASPRALLRPDPPPVGEALQEVAQQLRNLHPTRQERANNRNAVRLAQEEAAAEAAARAAMPDIVDFDVEDGVDGEKAQDHARSIKVNFNQADIRFWFSQIEDEMSMATIKSQWLKRSVLARNLPDKQKEDVKAYLTLPKTQAGARIYLEIKNKLVKIYAPTPSDSYCKALTRTMVGLPSQLGYQIVDDICKKPNKLDGCCCAGAAQALWTLQLPVNIRAHVSNLEFTKDSYKQVFDAADKVYLSSKQLSVAAVAAGSLDETLPAFSPQNQPQVAAFNRGGGRGGRGNRGGNRGGRGGGASASSGSGGGANGAGGGDKPKNNNRGKKHSSVPESQADKMCDRHYRHGADAWFCLKPLTCPWVSKVSERQ